MAIYRYSQDGSPLLPLYTDIFPDLNDDGIIYAVHGTESSSVYRYWFATDNGIASASTDLIEWLSLSDLAGKVIYCIAEDGVGNLWLGTETGLYKVDLTY